MKKALLAVAILCGLSGCVAQNLNKGLSALIGQNIRVAVAQLGYPDSQRTMMGDTIYVWNSSHNVSLPIVNTSTTTGMVGGVPVYGTTTSMGEMNGTFECTVQLATDADGTIKNYKWSGNMGGCQQYANAVSR